MYLRSGNFEPLQFQFPTNDKIKQTETTQIKDKYKINLNLQQLKLSKVNEQVIATWQVTAAWSVINYCMVTNYCIVSKYCVISNLSFDETFQNCLFASGGTTRYNCNIELLVRRLKKTDVLFIVTIP